MKGLFHQINKNLTFAYNLDKMVVYITYSSYVQIELPSSTLFCPEKSEF